MSSSSQEVVAFWECNLTLTTLSSVVRFADAVEGFSVFKGLAAKKDEDDSEKKVETGKSEDSEVVRRRKEVEREIEVMAFCKSVELAVSLFRKIVLM